MVIPIVILFAVTVLISIFPPANKKVESVLYWGIGTLLFIFAAFRQESGSPDYSTYVEMFQEYDSILVEPTYIIISWLIHQVSNNPIFIFLIYGGLAVYIKIKAINQISPLIILSLLTYISVLYIIQEHAQMRSGVATAFLFLSIKPLYDRNGKRFLLYSFIATLFHFSAAVMLPLWFMAKPNAKKWILWSIIPVGYIIYLAKINLISLALPFNYIQVRIKTYESIQAAGIDGFDSINVLGFGVVLKVVFFYSILLFRNLIKEKCKYLDIILLIYAIGVFFIPAFSTMPVLSFRLSAILVSVECLLFPMFYYVFSHKLVGRVFITIIAVVNFYLSIKILIF